MPKQMGRSGFIGRGWWSDAADAPPSSGADVGLEEVAEDGGDFARRQRGGRGRGCEVRGRGARRYRRTDEKLFHFCTRFFQAFGVPMTRIGPIAQEHSRMPGHFQSKRPYSSFA